jgi:hypothetical protein
MFSFTKTVEKHFADSEVPLNVKRYPQVIKGAIVGDKLSELQTMLPILRAAELLTEEANNMLKDKFSNLFKEFVDKYYFDDISLTRELTSILSHLYYGNLAKELGVLLSEAIVKKAKQNIPTAK